ncbi:hypothetical protein AAVH_26547 [Aphelenchoides avenae]|nr:hypothetical protein AAVH_26547 [Aphelenchus avenae]
MATEAEKLYKHFLARALEREFAAISGEKKAISQIAKDHEENAGSSYNEGSNWMAVKANRYVNVRQTHVQVRFSAPMRMTLKGLGALYLRQGKFRAAAITQSCALRSRHPYRCP